VRRSAVILLALLFLAAPLAAEAQETGKLYRVGFLSGGAAPSPTLPRLLEALRPLGYVEGQNLVIERRYSDGKADRLPVLAAELVQLRVDLIVTTGTLAARAAKQATPSIPIVFQLSGDPVENRLVASLARPGGNLTGFAQGLYEGKKLEVLTEAVSGVSRVACLGEEDASLLDAGRILGVQVRFLEVKGPGDLDSAFRAAISERADAVLVPDLAWIGNHLTRIAELAARSRLPAIGPGGPAGDFAKSGGLLYYGPTLWQHVSRLAGQVDKILKGAKPADLPVEQPTRFELVVNLKLAKALGLTIPQSLLLRADEVIQ